MAGFLIGAAGVGLQAVSTLEEGKAAADAGKFQQKQFEQEARATEFTGQYESRQIRKAARRARAKRIAEAGARGTTTTGTNLLALVDEAANFEADAQVTSFNRKRQAAGLRQKGDIARFRGRQIRRASRIRAATQIFSGGLKLLEIGN